MSLSCVDDKNQKFQGSRSCRIRPVSLFLKQEHCVDYSLYELPWLILRFICAVCLSVRWLICAHCLHVQLQSSLWGGRGHQPAYWPGQPALPQVDRRHCPRVRMDWWKDGFIGYGLHVEKKKKFKHAQLLLLFQYIEDTFQNYWKLSWDRTCFMFPL